MESLVRIQDCPGTRILTRMEGLGIVLFLGFAWKTL